ncbi:hypothetical protein E4T48_07713 [Aureobasidium sp. EXF-10727]|nr:hypothetical protein E4T48_07713 [Aureobasidium sp. EXF-10727]
MPLPTASFVGGVLVLAYLSTFVLFALLRILTGISIQRIGYSGFRRIAFSPKHGIKIYIRGVGLSLHRPTFAQPTWISLNLTEPQVVVDFGALQNAANTTSEHEHKQGAPDKSHDHGASQWKKLTQVKDKIKRLHTKIRYLCLVDLVAVSSSVTIKDVGTITVERITLAVDTRAKTVDRSRLFQHDQSKASSHTPAEWKSTIRSILFTPEGKESSEILDGMSLSIHGFLHPHLEGLRDASIALKLGRLDIPYDDLLDANDKLHQIRGAAKHETRNSPSVQAPKIAINDVLKEPQDAESREEELVEAVAESREFLGSVLKGIQEFQLAIGFLGLSRRIRSLHTSGQQVYFNMAMKELGLDLLRLDSRSPAHRMYFSPSDVAHQALLTAISISAGVDDGHDHPERMLYVPMVTATVKTTLPSKTIQKPDDSTNVRERNSNILFANLVCTSPSVDLDPKHLPLLLAIAKVRKNSKKSSKPPLLTSRGFLSRLLPKAIIKIAVQEPVVRVSLPPLSPCYSGDVEYDLLISSTSTMSLDIDSQHSSTDSAVKYGLHLHYRQTSSQLYYQTNAGHKHDLLQTDTIEVKVDINLLPQPEVFVYGRFQTFSVFLVRTEISEGIRQIVKAARRETDSDGGATVVKKPSFLRQVPNWLQHVSIQGADFNVELAGVDQAVSKYARGFALQLESWSAEYKAHREDVYVPVPRRRSLSRPFSRERNDRSATPEAPRKKQTLPTDGRRLALHIQGLEGHIIDAVEDSSADPFINLPKFEVAFSTSSDIQGPLFHINSHAKSLQLKYSLYKHFSIGVAVLTFRRMFLTLESHHADEERKKHQPSSPVKTRDHSQYDQVLMSEVTTIDFKANLIQVKADMPADPPLMIQIFGADCGRHRWATPFARLKVVRLLAGTPNMKQVWSRVVSVKNLRFDLREMKNKVGQKTEITKSFDLTTDVIRIGVPHGLVLHAIFDNIVNTVKTCEQLHHHFSTGTLEYILEKHPEGPKKIPRISVRAQLLLFEIEDSGFEWKLGTIYRAGLVEQQQRLAREEAFRLKVKNTDSQRQRRGSRVRTASQQPPPSRRRSLSRPATSHHRRSKSAHSIHTLREEDEESSPEKRRGRGRDRKIRYDTEGKANFNGANTRTVEKAHAKLQEFNAQSWKKRIDRALNTQSRAISDLRGILWGMNDLPDESEQSENVMAIPQRPALMAAVISDVGVIIDKPSFALDQYPHFLHDIGKGMPMDMKYGLLLPMSLKVTMGEARVMLRDYPLPLLHVPAIRLGQSPRLASLSLSTDFVIAEEFQGLESQRHINVVVVPKDKFGKDDTEKNFSIDVRRTISAVKTYSDMKIDINTSSPTRITWGTSYQPAIQDMMQVIENFTKPPMDPSDRVGFWDKIRLSFHSRLDVNWKGDGDVHLCLKGSRDPYVVTGLGAGFVMVWRNKVRWRIAQDDDPRKFMTVDSGDYVMAIPDYNYYARQLHEEPETDIQSGSNSFNSSKATAAFKKVVMKLSGNVQWMAGLTFEREVENGKRSFDFCPHYKVKLRHPDYAKAPPGGVYDAFKDFRSHWIHGSIAISAPQDRDWNVANLQPSKNYNSVHLSPRFFTHFYNWWSLFSGVMSLPVRQGPLWGSMEKSSKKFGRHLGTIKYNLLFSPLFISHIYKHKDAEDYQNDVVSATGLKMKLDSFMLDLHQRRETFEIPATADKKAKRTTAMKINQCQLDFISADIRAISASIKGTSTTELERADEATLASYQTSNITHVDMSKFTIPDNDLTWIDMDDFVELDWILPAETNPATKILPLGFAPRFTYFRQTDHGDSVSGDTTRSSIFGDEPTHYCVMSRRNDPRRVQADLIESRIHRIEEQMANNERAVGEQEVKVVRTHEGHEQLNERLRALKNHTEALQKKHEFLCELLSVLVEKLQQDDPSIGEGIDTDELPDRDAEKDNLPKEDKNPIADYTSDFNNRFVVHNAQIKWNNSLRNIILRYIHQVSQRRGFVYYMSRRAVKFILDILEEQKKSGPQASDNRTNSEVSNDATFLPMTPNQEDEMAVQDRIEQLLNDGRQFVNADDPETQECTETAGKEGGGEGISTEYTPQNTYHFRLIAPQIQLQSEKNPKSVMLVAAKGMQLKVVQIMDKERVLDEISGLVQTRFSAAMDSMQVFVASTKTFSTEYLHMYSGNRYGGKAGEYWPPWVPLEVMFEFQVNPYGFSRVVHRTSASLRYDKYNNLRLKYNDDVSGGDGNKTQNPDASDSRMDHVYIEFPHFRAICDSNQYFAMYIIVLDLLLYSEPLEKTRSERLEKIMLASDFSDLTGAPEMVEMLQARIRQLEDIKMHFQINEKYLDRQGWKDRITLDADLAACEDELFFMMKAITTSQSRVEDRNQEESPGLLRWLISSKEIAWHLIRGENESLLEFQIKDGLFDRTDNNDGSNYNCVEIGRINGFNLLPNAVYPEIIAPYIDPARGFHKQKDMKMLRVQWLMLEAIAGIPVVDYFEVNVMPLRVQLEREIAKRLFEYLFPGVGGNAFEGGGFSPFMVRNMAVPEDDEEDSDEKKDSTPHEESPTGGVGTGAGELEHRLQPTLKLPEGKVHLKNGKGKGLGINQSTSSLHNLHWNPFSHSDKSSSNVAKKQNGNTASNLSLVSRTPSQRSSETNSLAESEMSKKKAKKGKSSDKDDSKQASDDLSLMLSRASNYMTLSFFKVPSMVLCLSYKGQGRRNLEDVHDLVFRMPTLEYRNKTWSNLDLALQMKKDLIKALISHAGAIVGNKFHNHRPSRQAASSKLREMANLSTMHVHRSSAEQDGGSEASTPMTTSSMVEEEHAAEDDLDETPARPSFTSGRPSVFDDHAPSSPINSLLVASRTKSITPSLTMSLETEGGPVPPPRPRPQTNISSISRQYTNTSSLNTPAASRRSGESRHRSTSIGSSSAAAEKKGLFGRLRPGTSGSNGVGAEQKHGGSGQHQADGVDDEGFKTKLLLGGQKLLNKLPHGGKG